MKILVTGATGLVGKRLCQELILQGHKLVVISSSSPSSFSSRFSYPCEYISWESFDKAPGGVQAVIHLAGASLAEGRWSDRRKAEILESRTETTNKLYKAFTKAGYWPEVFIGASAIGFYGFHESHRFTEKDSPGSGFLAEVCQNWEKSQQAFQENCRLVQLRVGVVLDSRGGMLQKLEPLFSKGLGGVVGNGKQWMSWIHWKDLQKIILWALNSEDVSGRYNAVAQRPVTNKEFTISFSQQLGVMAPFPAPAFALKIVLGEMSQLALQGQNVSCEKLITTGFQFEFSDINSALKDIYSWKKKPQDQMFFSDQYFPVSRTRVYSFFSKAENLEKITPSSLGFKILSQTTPAMEEGTKINYKLKIHGLPIRWRTHIEEWDPNHRFIDTQEKGPYSKWHHTHSFVDFENGTLMTDEVIYRVPMGWLGNTFGGWFVKKDVNNIFSHRTSILDDLMPEIETGE